MKHGHVTGTKRERHFRRTVSRRFEERAAGIARMLRDKTSEELLAITPQNAAQLLRNGRQTDGTTQD